LSLTEKEFRLLLMHVRDCTPEYCDRVNADARSIVLATPKTGVHLFITYKELLQLQQMMETADEEVKVLELLQLFY
jgi:hypothetical protein